MRHPQKKRFFRLRLMCLSGHQPRFQLRFYVFAFSPAGSEKMCVKSSGQDLLPLWVWLCSSVLQSFFVSRTLQHKFVFGVLRSAFDVAACIYLSYSLLKETRPSIMTNSLSPFRASHLTIRYSRLQHTPNDVNFVLFIDYDYNTR